MAAKCALASAAMALIHALVSLVLFIVSFRFAVDRLGMHDVGWAYLTGYGPTILAIIGASSTLVFLGYLLLARKQPASATLALVLLSAYTALTSLPMAVGGAEAGYLLVVGILALTGAASALPLNRLAMWAIR